MTIHHATKARAEKEGIILNEVEGDNATFVEAHWPQRNKRLMGPIAKDTLDAMILKRMFYNEYDNLDIQFSDGQWEVSHTPTETLLVEADTPPTLAEVLELAEEQELDPGEGVEEERSQVVPHKYKVIYAENGNRDNCGDWLAETLDGRFINGDFFDTDAFTATLVANGVEMTGKWASLPTSGQRGWQGRYRMNGRQKLEIQVLRNGTLSLFGKDIAAPQGFLDAMAAKHPKIVKEMEKGDE